MQKTNDYDSSSDFVEGCNNNMSSDDNSDDNKEGNSINSGVGGIESLKESDGSWSGSSIKFPRIQGIEMLIEFHFQFLLVQKFQAMWLLLEHIPTYSRND